MQIEERLRALNITLPPVATPAAAYVPFVRTGSLVFLSGHIAKRDGQDWIINGSKMWITNGNIADVAVIWAQSDEGIRGFCVPTNTPGFKATLIKHKLSLRASITSELVFENMRVPDSYRLPEFVVKYLMCLLNNH